MPSVAMERFLGVLPESGLGIEFWGEAAGSFHPPARGARNKRSWMREPGKK